jgi:hypothetical protein
MGKVCTDLLASHQRKCDCVLESMVTWRFSSHQKVMKSLLVGTWYKPLHSVNYRDSCAHGYEWSGILVGFMGFWDGYVLVTSGWSITLGNYDWGGVAHR